MSHFYGTLEGSRGAATRCGTAGSGITAAAQGWTGSVTVMQYERHGADVVDITVRRGSGVSGTPVFEMPTAALVEAVGNGARLMLLTLEERQTIEALRDGRISIRSTQEG